MRNGLWIVLCILLLTAGCGGYIYLPESGYATETAGPDRYGPQEYGAAQEYGAEMDIDYMYTYLAPYGNWINLSPYGYVWTPRRMGYQWRPYSDGRWVMTEYGWTWIENEPWGSIPFHYGRWGHSNDFGWFWVPDTVWGPAWVNWRWSDRYTGWAPLQPGVEFRYGMDFASLSINIPNHYWVFLQTPHFLNHDIHRYILPYERNATIINFASNRNHMNFRNNRIFNEGIGIDMVRRVTRQQVVEYRTQDIRQPGPVRITGNDVQVYRPSFRANAAVRPKAFLDSDKARQELAPIRTFEPRQQLPLSMQAAEVRRRQAEEKTLLRNTQSQELQEMERRRAGELAQTRDTAARTKLRQDNQVRMTQLRNQHQAEQQQLTARHKKDTEQVNRVTRKADQRNQAPARSVKKEKKENRP